MNFNVLPSLVALAILVVVFQAILRQGAAERLQLWLTAWVLVLIHFVAQFVNVGHGLWSHIATAISLGSLELASVSFLISMSPRATTARRQLLLGTILGLPALAYTTAAVWGVAAHSFYYGVVVVAFAASFAIGLELVSRYNVLSCWPTAWVSGVLLVVDLDGCAQSC